MQKPRTAVEYVLLVKDVILSLRGHRLLLSRRLDQQRLHLEQNVNMVTHGYKTSH